jgi:pimeloyl-ACP methyl ester carboxylesterase
MEDALFKLSDSRVLSYAVYGAANGKPVLYFHGTPSSRLEPTLLKSFGQDPDELAANAGLQIIAIDRPGNGLSSFNSKNNFLSVARDAKELLDHLQVKECAVLCWSGGGPFALAMAHSYPLVVYHVSIICGFARKFDKAIFAQMGMNKWYFRFARYTPWAVCATMDFLRNKKINRVPPQWITGLPYVDYKLVNSLSHFRELARISMKEAARNGGKGPVAEARSYYKELGFEIAAIHCPVHYWWGTRDMSVIRLHAEEVERKIPGAVMHFREGEGHLSLYINHFADVLKTMQMDIRLRG